MEMIRGPESKIPAVLDALADVERRLARIEALLRDIEPQPKYRLEVKLGDTWELPALESGAALFFTERDAAQAWDALVESDPAWGEREHRIVPAA